AVVTDMVGNWTRTITTNGPVNLRVEAEVAQAPNYETDEFSQASVIVDGDTNIISRVRGNGNGGGIRSTGFVEFNLPLDLQDGEHTISLSCFNNKKTLSDEISRCRFDNLTIESTQ